MQLSHPFFIPVSDQGVGEGVIVRVAVAEGTGVAMLTGTLSSSPMNSGVVSLNSGVIPLAVR